MKAAVFYGKHDLRIEEQPVAVPGDNEVLIKVHACGICGTDVHIFNGDEGAAKSPSGTILGHEFAGEVVQAGAGVKKLKVGDRVCVDPNYLCAECYYCQSGRGHFCENMVGIGTTVNGGFAEYCVVPECQAYVFSKETSYEKAAMCEPVACCLHGIDMCDIACGDTVAVIGGGMIGLIMLQLARLRGAAKLILIEPVKEKRDMAVSLGADITIDPIATDVMAELAKYGIDRISTVIECVGKPATMSQAVQIAGKKSTVMMFGLTAPEETLTIKPFELFKKEITLKASFINPYTQKRALELIESGKVDVESMVCSISPLEDLPEILSSPALRAKGKYIIQC